MRRLLLGLLLGLVLGGALFFLGVIPLDKMKLVIQSPSDRIESLSSLRDLAINKAREEGKYRCCINPPCTMCFWEGNRWNNNTPGTCDCDGLIAKGEEPCPQCARAIESGQCGSSGAKNSPVCSPK